MERSLCELGSTNLCQHTHTWLWTSGYSEEVPEGMLCQCGRMKAHYELCEVCGVRNFKPIPVEEMPNEG